MKQSVKWFASLLFAVSFLVLTEQGAQAAGEILEVGEVRSLGSEVRVPVTLYQTAQLTSLNAEISVAENQQGVTLKKFEPAGIFANGTYRYAPNIVGNTLTIDFLSQADRDPTLGRKATVVGYITYELSSAFKEGESVQLYIDSVRANGRLGVSFILHTLEGKIERKMPIGGVVPQAEGPNVAAAMRILQHVNGSALIVEKEMILSADVNADGIINQDDAEDILKYVSGEKTSFLSVQLIEPQTAVLNSDYRETATAKHGRGPYTFKRSGTLPNGLKLDADTGEITGKPTRIGSFNFTITATDAVGNVSSPRAFQINVIDSAIASVEKLAMVNVKKGEKVSLPEQVAVVYKDKQTGFERVKWDEIDTDQLGEFIVKGTIGDEGFTITVVVNVIDQNYLNHVGVEYLNFLNIHTIIVSVNSSVTMVTLNDIDMHYEGNNEFGLVTSSFNEGTTAVIRLFDKYGNLLETKSHRLVGN